MGMLVSFLQCESLYFFEANGICVCVFQWYICRTDTGMKDTVVSVMLGLIFALVEIHSQTVPYISSMGNYLPNHTYIDFNPVSENADNGIQCHTDLTTCCSSSEKEISVKNR